MTEEYGFVPCWGGDKSHVMWWWFCWTVAISYSL